MSEKKMGDLRYRIPILTLSAVLLILFIFLGAYHPLRWVFVAFAATIASIALFEYYMLLRKKELHPTITFGIVMTILYIFALFFKTQGPHPFWEPLWQKMPEIMLGIAFFGCFVHFFNGKNPILNSATSFFGIVYMAVPFGMFVRIMYFFLYNGVEDPHFQGSWWVLYLVFVTKSADMGGYFVGRNVGKKKLAFNISPNKTLEGALAGLVSSVIISLLICYLGKRFAHVFVGFTYLSAIWLGILIGILGQIGDLAESLLKRDANVKDSNTLPGVGGILDMTDSILFTSPVVYIFLRVLYT